MADRRSFLKRFLGGAAAAAVLTVVPETAAKLLAPKPVPSPLFVSIGSKRPGWTARCLRLGARIRTIRAAAVATGVAAAAAMKAALRWGGDRPIWSDPVFRPSLRNITDGTVR